MSTRLQRRDRNRGSLPSAHTVFTALLVTRFPLCWPLWAGGGWLGMLTSLRLSSKEGKEIIFHSVHDAFNIFKHFPVPQFIQSLHLKKTSPLFSLHASQLIFLGITGGLKPVITAIISNKLWCKQLPSNTLKSHFIPPFIWKKNQIDLIWFSVLSNWYILEEI